MNFMYSFWEGPAEIFVAAAFFLMSRHIRGRSDKITIMTSKIKHKDITPGPMLQSKSITCDTSDILVTMGLRPGAGAFMAARAAKAGIICHENISKACTILSETDHAVIVSSELGVVSRMMHCTSSESGILFAHIMYGEVEIV
jgi:hypothetical protein